MKEMKIVLGNIQDVREFVNLVVMVEYEVDLSQGRYLIDAKSIMGIFSLDLLSPITVVAHSDNTAEFFEKLSRGGCEIYQSKIGTHFPVGTRVRIYGKNGFFALGEIIPESECKAQDLGSAVKAIKTFELQ